MRRAPFKLGKLKFNHVTLALQAALLITLLVSFFFYTQLGGSKLSYSGYSLPEGLVYEDGTVSGDASALEPGTYDVELIAIDGGEQVFLTVEIDIAEGQNTTGFELDLEMEQGMDVNAANLLINAAIAIAVSFVIEILFLRMRGRWNGFKDMFFKENPLLVPLLVVLLLPLHATWFIVFIATVMAVWIGKLVYGGFGYNIFNPAIVGVLFAYLSFRTTLGSPEGIMYPIEMLKLAGQSNQIALLSQQSLFIGGMYYPIGAGALSGLVLAIIFLVLAAFKIIDWRLTVTYLVTVFGISFIIGGSYFAMEHVLSGLVLFGAVFLVTDPVTTPTSRETKLVFAVIVGLLTVMVRILGSNTEGVLFAVLLGNIFTPYINRTARQSNMKSLIKTLVFLIAVIVLGGLAIGFINAPAEVAEFVAMGVNF